VQVRREANKRIHIILLGAFLAIGLVVPMTALGADDDCPPPSEQPLVDPGYVENDDPPAGGDGSGGGAGGDGTTDGTSEDGGVFGSLGTMSGGQLTVGILAVVGVIVGSVYFFMVSRMDDDILE
jgi:hypothetical protein